MQIGNNQFTELAVVDASGKVLVSVSDGDIIEHDDCKVLFGTKEKPIEYSYRGGFSLYAHEKGMDYGQSGY